MKKNSKIRIYKDSKELPFSIYKRIVQSGDFFYMVKGYEPGDNVKADIKQLKDKFNEIEEDYATSMNTKNSDVLLYGEIATVTNEFNKYNIIFLLIEEFIKCDEVRENLIIHLNEELLFAAETGTFEEFDQILQLIEKVDHENSEFKYKDIQDLLMDFKIQKSDDPYKQQKLIQNKLDKLNNQLEKLKNQLKKSEDDQDSDIDIEEQFVSVCLGLEIPVDDTKITLYQYGLMVKALIKRVEEINKLNNHVR